MERYILENEIGEGTFGNVFRATSKSNNGNVVAIKKIKNTYDTFQQAISCREVQTLYKLSLLSTKCNYIVELMEVIMDDVQKTLYLVFEYMPNGSLHEYMSNKSRQQQVIPVETIQSFTWQIIQGLSFLHENGYVHRDIKPENILLDGSMNCKVADFSLTRRVPKQQQKKEYNHDNNIDNNATMEDILYSLQYEPEIQLEEPTIPNNYNNNNIIMMPSATANNDNDDDDGDDMSVYVSTRWYRAPEVLLCSTTYSTQIDMYALGCVMAELYRLYPLFPGSSEVDQIHLITQIMGQITPLSWPAGAILASNMGLQVVVGCSDKNNIDDDDYSPMYLTNRKRKKQRPKSPLLETTTWNEQISRLKQCINRADDDAIALIANLLQWDPDKRISSHDIQYHPYFVIDEQIIYQNSNETTFPVVQNHHTRQLSRSPQELPSDQLVSFQTPTKTDDNNNIIIENQPKHETSVKSSSLLFSSPETDTCRNIFSSIHNHNDNESTSLRSNDYSAWLARSEFMQYQTPTIKRRREELLFQQGNNDTLSYVETHTNNNTTETPAQHYRKSRRDASCTPLEAFNLA